MAQIGSVEYRNVKAYYQFRVGPEYLETGGFVNTVTATDQFFRTVDPNGAEWSTCSPITAHELTHSTFSDVRKPVWADEGLAEFTSRKAVGTPLYCEDAGWREGASAALRPFVSLSQQTWRSDLDHYMTAACAYEYIEDRYGQAAISNIYGTLRSKRSFEVTAYCGPTYDFYRDVIVANTDLAMRGILATRFGIPENELSCSVP